MADSIRVLHVDDDPAFLDLSADFLSGEVADFEVETATGVADGLARLDGETFDCVVSDYQMPERDGLEFLEAVRERWPHLPFILFTGQGSEAVASEAVTQGATDYLQKGRRPDQYRLLANRVGNAVESHRAQRELERYRTLVETVGDAMYVLDPDGVVTLANEAMAAMLETDREAVVGTHASAFMADGDFERGTDLIVDILEDPDRDWGTFEMTVVTTTGREVPGEISVAPITTDGGEYGATVGVVRDVTARKRRVDSLQALHETTRGLIDAGDVDEAIARAVEAAVEVLDLDKVAFFEAVDGADALEPAAASGFDSAALERVERGAGPVWDAYETGEASFESGACTAIEALDPAVETHAGVVVPADGHGVLVAGSTEPVEFEETTEELARVLASNLSRAIASLRREERLRERERELERYERIIEVMGDGVYALDAEGRFTYVNSHMEEATGYAREELIGETPSKVVDDLSAGEFEEGIGSLLSGERESFTTEIHADPADGEPYPIEVNIAPILTDDGFQGTVGVSRDVRERKEREAQLELYETAVESTMDGLAVSDESGEFLLVNRVFAEAVGLTRAEMEGRVETPETADFVLDVPDGIDRRYEEAAETARREGHSQFRFESVVDTVDGEEVIENVVTARRREDGSVIFVTSTRQITERKERERELERQNERLDEFARVVSHDLRTPLSVASGRLQLAKTECDSEYLADVEDAIERMDTLIDETLAMARQGRTVSEREAVDLAELLPTCWEAIDAPEASLSIEDAATLLADRGRLRRVFENLFRNAVEHGSTSPPSQAREDAVEHGGDGVAVRVGTTEDGLYVADDGPGITESDRSDVFSPGYTTAEAGTGFGLTIVSEIVEAHGWEITVGESEAGGARFEIRGVEFAD